MQYCVENLCSNITEVVPEKGNIILCIMHWKCLLRSLGYIYALVFAFAYFIVGSILLPPPLKHRSCKIFLCMHKLYWIILRVPFIVMKHFHVIGWNFRHLQNIMSCWFSQTQCLLVNLNYENILIWFLCVGISQPNIHSFYVVLYFS